MQKLCLAMLWQKTAPYKFQHYIVACPELIRPLAKIKQLPNTISLCLMKLVYHQPITGADTKSTDAAVVERCKQ